MNSINHEMVLPGFSFIFLCIRWYWSDYRNDKIYTYLDKEIIDENFPKLSIKQQAD